MTRIFSSPRNSLAGLGAAALLCTALTGCAARADLDQLQGDNQQLRGTVAADHQAVTAFDQRLRRLEDQLQQLRQSGIAAAQAGPQGPDRMASIEDRVNRLEASMTAVQAAAGTPAASGATASPAGAAATGAPSGGLASSEEPPSGGRRTAPAETAPASAAPGWQADLDKELDGSANSREKGIKLYRDGLEAMKAGKYPAAIERFSNLQKKFPKSPLTEPAEYFSATAFYELGKYDQSVLQYNDLVMRFPKGRFASAALLREAHAFLKGSNDKIDARLTLNKLINEHPDAPEVSAASDMMKDLERD